jgi:PPOX class probable F420-dependent enzyme
MRRTEFATTFCQMARTDITMSPNEVQEFLAQPQSIQVATTGPDGFPHLAPMWYAMEEGKVAFRSFAKSQKIVNLTRDPRLTLLVETGEAYAELQGVMIKGRATLVTDPAYVLEMYGKLAARYAFSGKEPAPRLDAEALQEAFGRFASKNTAVIVEPVKVISWDHHKLGGKY